MYVVQHVHSPERAFIEEDIQKARSTIIAAFDFVLDSIGSDLKSGDLWMRYIRFVKAGEVSIQIPFHNIYDDNHRHNLATMNNKKWIC